MVQKAAKAPFCLCPWRTCVGHAFAAFSTATVLTERTWFIRLKGDTSSLVAAAAATALHSAGLVRTKLALMPIDGKLDST